MSKRRRTPRSRSTPLLLLLSTATIVVLVVFVFRAEARPSFSATLSGGRRKPSSWLSWRPWSSPVRTSLTFRCPDVETGRRMFRRAAADGGGGGEEDLRFNHDSVGLTNPCLHIAVPVGAAEPNPNLEDNCGDGVGGGEGSWWFPPPAAVSADRPSDRPAEDGKWRVLRYCRRVGVGERCYAAVRDAALEWEFQSTSSPPPSSSDNGGARAVGIVKVPPSARGTASGEGRFLWRHRPQLGEGGEIRRHAGYEILDNVPWNDCGGLADPLSDEAARNVRRIVYSSGGSSSGCGLSSVPGRRMITYSETSLGGGGGRIRVRLPLLYAVSPVAVVYDLVDQRGPDGAMYTSTAYATLRGHLLSGEERVTVALRNGGHGGSGCLSRSSAAAPNFDGSGSSGYVDVEILSYSRAAPSFLGRLAWVFIGGMQDQFFRRQMDALERIAKEHSLEETKTSKLLKIHSR